MRIFALLRGQTTQVVPDDGDVVEFEQPSDPSPESVFLTAATRSLDLQISAFDVPDGKAAQAFSVGSLTLPITFTLINLAPDRVDIPREAIWSLWGALAAYILLIFFIFRSNRFNAISTDVNLQVLEQYSQEFPGVVLQRWIAEVYAQAATDNLDTLFRKGRWVALAYFALWAEGLTLAGAAITTLLFGL